MDTTIVEESSSREQLGEFFVENDSSMTFKVYDENGKYLRSVSFAEYMTSTNSMLSASANNEGVVLLQFLKALPSTSTDYDYIYDGVKYNLVSVAKSLKTGKSVDLKLDDGVVYAIYPDEDYNYTTGTKSSLHRQERRSPPNLGPFTMTPTLPSHRLLSDLPAPLPP